MSMTIPPDFIAAAGGFFSPSSPMRKRRTILPSGSMVACHGKAHVAETCEADGKARRIRAHDVHRQMLASKPASILNHKSRQTGIPSDSVKS